MPFFGSIIDRIAGQAWVENLLSYLYSLSDTEIRLIIILIALLFAFLVYRVFGAGIFWVLLFMYMIAYIVYRANISDKIEERDSAYDARMQNVQKEIDRK
jgi:hypothetical protein